MIFVSSWPARPTNGIALHVLVGARRLADEHQVGVADCPTPKTICLRPERVQLAARAVADVVADRHERVGRGRVLRPERRRRTGRLPDLAVTFRRVPAPPPAVAHARSRQAGSRLTPATPSSAAKRRSPRCSVQADLCRPAASRPAREPDLRARPASPIPQQPLDAVEDRRRPRRSSHCSGNGLGAVGADDASPRWCRRRSRRRRCDTSLATIRSTCLRAPLGARRASTTSSVSAAKPTSTGCPRPRRAPLRPSSARMSGVRSQRERHRLVGPCCIFCGAALGRRVIGDGGGHHDDVGARRRGPAPPRASRPRAAHPHQLAPPRGGSTRGRPGHQHHLGAAARAPRPPRAKPMRPLDRLPR